MPLQNRVTPEGVLIADPARGLLMGNRGILHDETRRLGAALWRHTNWVACRLAFKDRRRPVMAPGHYTELFFLDEAVAFAAGHRPCAECRREDYRRFTAAFCEGTGLRPENAAALDRVLHAARVVPRRRMQKTHEARLADLPDGVFLRRAPEGPPLLLAAGRLHPYAPAGYGAALPAPREDGLVTVLTPAPVVAALSAGYRPLLHPSLGAAGG